MGPSTDLDAQAPYWLGVCLGNERAPPGEVAYAADEAGPGFAKGAAVVDVWVMERFEDPSIFRKVALQSCVTVLATRLIRTKFASCKKDSFCMTKAQRKQIEGQMREQLGLA